VKACPLATETRYAGCYAFGTGGFSLLEPVIRSVAEMDHHALPAPVKRAGEGAPPGVATSKT